jgi:DNA-binding IclR family transcriptional regulator
VPVQTVDRAIAVLNILSASKRDVSLTEVSQRLGLHKSTVHRLLASLEKGGLVDRPPASRKYRLGMGLIELGNAVLNSRALPQAVLPYLRYISDTVEEVAYLAVRDEDEIVNILQMPSPHLLQSVGLAERAPLHCTSAGKVFLAHMSEEELKPLLEKGLPQSTAKTVTDAGDLRDELERVREQGFATAFGEYREDIVGIAVPITISDGTVVGAIGVVGPLHRFTPEKVMRFSDIIRGVAREASQQLASLSWEALQML